MDHGRLRCRPKTKKVLRHCFVYRGESWCTTNKNRTETKRSGAEGALSTRRPDSDSTPAPRTWLHARDSLTTRLKITRETTTSPVSTMDD